MINATPDHHATVTEMYREPTTEEVLEKALEYVQSGWMQGTIGNPDGSKVCSLGALNKACSGNHMSTPYTGTRGADAFEEATSLIAQQITGDITRNGRSKWNTVATFNDDPHTTLEDVTLVFKKALHEAIGDDE